MISFVLHLHMIVSCSGWIINTRSSYELRVPSNPDMFKPQAKSLERITFPLYGSLGNNNEREDDNNEYDVQEDLFERRRDDVMMDEAERMRIVRSLQESFYKTVSSSQMNVIASALEEECSNPKQQDAGDDTVIEECKLLDTDSPESIIELNNAKLADVEDALHVSSIRRYDDRTGKILNLPLWRVSWTEVPFRTNILSVHEAMYTNMFEEILHSEQPWYVGHLYLPGGSANLRYSGGQNSESSNKLKSTTSPTLELQAWYKQQQTLEREDEYVDDTDKSATLGTLLRITDYRRLQDGKLLLMVQALYRFVVTDVVQAFPYGVAHVQLLPDVEEYGATNQNVVKLAPAQTKEEVINEIDTLSLLSSNEDAVYDSRVHAIQESFNHWQQFEFDETLLPIKKMDYIPITEVVGASIVKLVPFASFSQNESDLKKALKANTDYVFSPDAQQRIIEDDEAPDSTPDPCLEQQLFTAGIMKEPFLFQKESLMQCSIDELELRLWLTLNDYAKNTRAQIPLVLLELLPHNVQWPKSFVLSNIVSVMEKLAVKPSGKGIVFKEGSKQFRRVSKRYPSIRRQQRLSYHAAQLLEDPDDKVAKNILRQQLLQIPSIKSRLVFVSQQFESRERSFE